MMPKQEFITHIEILEADLHLWRNNKGKAYSFILTPDLNCQDPYDEVFVEIPLDEIDQICNMLKGYAENVK